MLATIARVGAIRATLEPFARWWALGLHLCLAWESKQRQFPGSDRPLLILRPASRGDARDAERAILTREFVFAILDTRDQSAKLTSSQSA